MDPKTLARTARDYVASRPDFALEVALLALYWIAQGHGYEISATDVLDARSHPRGAAERLGSAGTVDDRIAQAVQGTTVSAKAIQRILMH